MTICIFIGSELLGESKSLGTSGILLVELPSQVIIHCKTYGQCTGIMRETGSLGVIIGILLRLYDSSPVSRFFFFFCINWSHFHLDHLKIKSWVHLV